MTAKAEIKKKLRKQIRHKLASLSPETITQDSLRLCDLLTFPPKSRIALFASTSREPALLDLLKLRPDLHCFLPKMNTPGEMDFIRIFPDQDLAPGRYNILEPISGERATNLDFIVCPGVAFTTDGKRLGQGGGYYDRILPRFPQACSVGVAFDCQIVSDLPTEIHDCRMKFVLTPSSAPPTGILG